MEYSTGNQYFDLSAYALDDIRCTTYDAGMLTRSFMCVTNANQAKIVERIFFVEQRKLGTFGQNIPSLFKNYFLCKDQN